jgi:2-desacetyl-2-hydroxyethyl bacteriochlorophyllide A dehydrogenase
VRALVISKPGEFGVESVPDPSPAAREIVVAPRATGICGTDLHIIDGHFPPAPYPIIPGHEFAGEVVATGSEVTGFRVGQRVVVDPSLFCGECVYCRRQRGNLCLNWGATGDTVNGAFAELVSVPAVNAFAMPDEMSWEAGALVEPLACVVHGLRRLAMPPGAELLVVGAGTIGLLLLQAAARSGAASVYVVDPDPARRRLAVQLGAAGAAAEVSELLDGRGIGFEYAVEASGTLPGAQAAMAGLCRGGVMLVFGVAPADSMLPVSQFQVYNDEISIIGSMAVLSTFEPAMRLMTAGAIAVPEMVTHAFPLAEFADAVDAVRNRKGLKIQVSQA